MTITEHKPTEKTVLPINFLFFRTETKLNELAKFFHVAPELYEEAAKLGLEVAGPIHWHYFGFTDPSKSFTLEIALPVNTVLKEYDGSFHFKRTENFKCVALIHEGDWLQIPATYQKLAAYANEHRLNPENVSREIYMTVDFAKQQANVTEVQLGIQ